MAYEPTIWKDRIVEKPKTYTMQNNPDGTITLIPAPGIVTEEGTPVNANNLNKLEQGLKSHEADNAKQHADLGYNIYQLYLQNYYEGKYPYKRGLFFDGFANKNVVDYENSTVNIDVVNKIINTGSIAYANQLLVNNEGGIGVSDPTSKVGQVFKIENNIILKSIIVDLYKNQSPTDGVICKLYNVSDGKPTTELAISSNEVPSSAIGDSASTSTKIQFLFDEELLPGIYAFALERTGSLNTTNYYKYKMSTLNSYIGGTLVDYRDSTEVWSISANNDFYFEIMGQTQNPIYQSKEQILQQNISNAILYVKYKMTDGCNVTPAIAVYTDTKIFRPMIFDSSRDLGGGYQEDKFTFNTSIAGNKVIIKLTLNRPNTSIDFEVNQYGCVLGVS